MRNFDRRYLSLALLAAVLIGIAILIPPLGGTILVPALTGLFGAKIGSDPEVACIATGGKWGPTKSQCVTRACFAAHDCGYWAHPDVWRNRVKVGDDIATVIFWFGEADRPVSEQDWTGDTSFYWDVGMCCGPLPRFSATFKDGHLVRLSPIVEAPDPCCFQSASL